MPSLTKTPAPTNLLAISKIVANSRQPRQQFDQDALEELAASIREFGIIQPLVVREIGVGQYEIIAGERRFRAAKLTGLKEVPVVIRNASPQVSLEIALIENVQREDITAVECAIAYKRLMDEFGLSQDQVAQRVGKSRVAISNTIRILRLPSLMQEAILAGSLSEGHARALLMIDSPIRQEMLFERILAEGLSVREVERLARSVGQARPPQGEAPSPRLRLDPNWKALEQRLSERFGTPAKLTKAEVGGKLTVDFYSDEDLQRLLDLFQVEL